MSKLTRFLHVCSTARRAYNVLEQFEVSHDLKLHADTPTAQNTVTAYGPGFVEINRARHTTHVVVTPELVERWPVTSFETLDTSDFEHLRDLRSEVVLLGTGTRQRFPHPRLTRPLADARIGLEVMDTQAACRTYNILAAEGRRVAAALFVETER